jgi:uncharacterized protein YyaL (SSP411 family)
MSASGNRLGDALSPYLLQHRDNPVDWYPWGPEAFERARSEDRPILLSVGYSACHWCHVMAHESFENPEIAALMNRHFVNIKVDREERPDVDAVYMSAVQAMTGSGGWPMTVVMTPEGEPFFGGTYFPPDDRFGRPGFPRVLTALAEAWEQRRDEVLRSAGEIRGYLGDLAAIGGESGPLSRAPIDEALEALQTRFDPEYGGFGGAPKFPPHSALALLQRLPPTPGGNSMIATTLTRMAQGGLFDQLGGGFARYSVDAIWQAPHFEKMLYDNAQLVPRYAAAWLRNGNPLYRDTVALTLDWVEREMTAPEGGFYSALDADSEGEEGRFYLWDHAVIEAQFDDAELVLAAYGVSEAGNFEGRNILERRASDAELAERFGLSESEVVARIEEARALLFEARAIRERPGLDDKILTSWNGLMLGAYADAGRTFDRPDWLAAARRCARYLYDHAWQGGRLLHALKGTSARIEGLLEDYAYLGLGLLRLYRATYEPEWLLWALELGRALPERFGDGESGGFFTTAADAEALVVRLKDHFDAAVPSGNGAAAELLAQLGRYLGGSDEGRRFEALAESAIAPLLADAGRAPTGFATLLLAADRLLAPPREVAVIGPRDDPRTAALLEALRLRDLATVAVAHAEGPNDPLVAEIPWLQQRDLVEGAPAAYVCEGGACKLPVTDPEALAAQLDGAKGA